MDNLELWLDSAHQRYFLIPVDVYLPMGALVLHSPAGDTRYANEADVLPYETSEADAKRYFRGELRPFTDFLIDALTDYPVEHRSAEADLINAQIEAAAQIPPDPAQLKAELRATLTQLADWLDGKSGLPGIDIEQVSATLAKEGVVFDTNALRKLMEKPAASDKRQRQPLIAQLRAWAAMFDDDQDANSIDLDAIVRQLEDGFYSLPGFRHIKKRREERDRREIRANADNAIARALRANGFEVDDNPDPDA